jgi:type I restriction enzyme S subunit
MSDELTELPEGWGDNNAWRTRRMSSGGTPSRKNSEYYNGDISWIKTGDLPDGLIEDIEEKITTEGLANSSAKIFPRNSLAVAMYGATIGKLGILKEPAATNQACAVLKAGGITSDLISYLFFYLLSSREDLRMIGQGGAQPNISQTILKEYPCPLPPLNEQKRIVAKIEELNDRQQRAKQALKAIPELCDRFRQSVLAAAFQGDLTADWREQNPDVEPASVLLERIKTERFNNWKINEERKALLKETQFEKVKGRKYTEPVAPDTSTEITKPDGWLLVSADQITYLITDGKHGDCRMNLIQAISS